MNTTVAGALIGLLAALVGIVGTVLVARMGAQNSRQINQDTIKAAHGEAARARADAEEALRASREDARLALDTTREAQFADRYSRAIEQLGSSSPDIQSGGIYALEGIARDSPEWYHPVIMEVLTAFIREHPRTPPDVSSAQRRPPADLQAAVSVVGRRTVEHDIRTVDLSGADLVGAALKKARLGGADLGGADLTGAHLIRADLVRADLTGARLDRARLQGAHLDRAVLLGAHFTGADLSLANLTGAELDGADFTAARLARTKWPVSVPIPAGWEPVGGPEEQGRVFVLKRAHASPEAAAGETPLQTGNPVQAESRPRRRPGSGHAELGPAQADDFAQFHGRGPLAVCQARPVGVTPRPMVIYLMKVSGVLAFDNKSAWASLAEREFGRQWTCMDT
jgi:uncharacterized protein YjbI with pentapeptide repeats